MVDQEPQTQPVNPFAAAAQNTEPEQPKTAPIVLGDLIRDGFYDKLVLIGFPYDEGARKAGNRRGADFGPDSFRRFVKDSGSVRNPEYGVNIAAAIPHIADYGNIQIESELKQDFDPSGQVIGQKIIKPTIGALYAKLATKVGLCLQREFIPFVIGGSRDLFQPIFDAYLANSAKLADTNPHHVTFLSVNHSLDVAPLLSADLCHQTSTKRYLAEKMPQNYSLVEFGLEGRLVAQQDLDYFQGKVPVEKRSIIWRSQLKSGRTLQLWNELLDGLVGQAHAKHFVHISVNMESIEGLKGVSTNCLSGGISTEDAVEMCYQAGLKLGKAGILASMDLCEYNPYVEDQQTGRFAATLFYYVTLGLSQGLQQRGTL